MSETYYSKELGVKREDDQFFKGLSAFMGNDLGIEISKRQNPELFARRMHVKQENIQKIKRELGADERLHPALANGIRLNSITYEGQDGVLTALTPAQAAQVKADTSVRLTLRQMRRRRWEAWNPTYTDAAGILLNNATFMLARSQQNDYNERKLQSEAEIKRVVEQKVGEITPDIRKKTLVEKIMRR